MPYRVIGHRGDKANYIENTLAGFKSVLETDGVDGFEFDVVVTKDEELVISHDNFIKDVKINKFIYNLTYSELRKLSHKIYGASSCEETRYPTLEDVCKLYLKQASKKTMLLEIKSIPFNNTLPLSFSQLIKKVHTLLEKYNIIDKCYIISFDYRIIEESYKQNPQFKIGQILHSNLIPLLPLAKQLNLSLFIMNKDWVTKEQIIEMNKENIDIYVWTANTKVEWSKLREMGINGIVTDRPKALSQFK
jgi:glycerophosphoryl diester phosphodiesterase